MVLSIEKCGIYTSEKAANMIELRNSFTKEEIRQANDARIKESETSKALVF
mgnify:CR=1 FL=1